jgi:hypothetical protein
MLLFVLGNATPQYSNPIVTQAMKIYTSSKKLANFKSKYMVFINFNEPDSSKRLYIIDIQNQLIVFRTYVAHGKNSGGLYATSFSNSVNSHQSSLGTYMTVGTYYGHAGLSMKLRGLERTNSNAERRMVVLHGANYASTGGHSWGCFAIPRQSIYKVIKIIGSNALIYAYHN